ncbi:MAG: hypothetical protein LBR15_00890 [Methanobrevibacter sp.]|jgi:hypothetical protein|nr:hypothetical protein [Candidatus Methanovirga australis]
MTIAVIMQVNDGLVLATDSASTIVATDANGNNSAAHVYFNADKIFNLIKGLPVGCMTWGNGSIGNASISTIVKDFRNYYYEKNKSEIDNGRIEIEKISQSFKDFTEKKIKDANGSIDLIGFVIAGYSKDKSDPEIFQLEFIKDRIRGPKQINKKDPVAISWYGDIEMTSRLILGMSTRMPQLLKDAGLSNEKSNEIVHLIQKNMQLPIGAPAMPIQDAIDFIEFLVNFNCEMSKFMPGAQTIGGPIDLAVITKHESFKWVYRKYYYEEKLNRGNINDK